MATSMEKRALIVRGGWTGHQPVETTDAFIPFLTEQGYDVRVEDTTAVYADAGYLAGVDLIVQTNTMSTIETDELRGLMGAVASGTGLAGWHGGIADSYRSSSDYLQLVGGQFAAHPPRAPREELAGEAADNFVRHTIEIVPERADHPIVAGIGDFELTTEQYWVLTDEYNEVLATTTLAARDFDPWHRPVTCPAIWTRQWGEGRVFVSTPGHELAVVQDPNVRTVIERGILWASR
ncbi:ThuA domain-containing protein [Promicromonospora sp. NPDC050880]|uniref:ThuA domain-containing protein n=1 Tax=Promicromonospora sp. NPDC050880 TaxID=3364406 RepID=UPI003795EE90